MLTCRLSECRTWWLRPGLQQLPWRRWSRLQTPSKALQVTLAAVWRLAPQSRMLPETVNLHALTLQVLRLSD